MELNGRSDALASLASAIRSSAYALTRASSVKPLLRPLGLGRIQAIVPANPVGGGPSRGLADRSWSTRRAFRERRSNEVRNAASWLQIRVGPRLNSSGETSAALLVGRRTTAVMPQPYSSRRRSSCGWRRTISETGEMQHRPEAIGSIREIVARDGGARSRIETAENHVQTFGEDIRIISTIHETAWPTTYRSHHDVSVVIATNGTGLRQCSPGHHRRSSKPR